MNDNNAPVTGGLSFDGERILPPDKKKLRAESKAMKLKRKREKEIFRWEKELNRRKPVLAGINVYLVYLIFVISLIYAVDEIASQIKLLMQTEIANYYFAGGNSVTIKTLSESVVIPFTVLGLFYRPLADKWGRKKFLVINTIGMSAGLFVMFLAENAALYLLGTCLIMFFIPHDMHVVYIMESAPPKKRAIMYSVIKFFANMSVMLIPLMRRMFMTEDVSTWRNVCFFPALLGVIFGLLALMLAREPETFVESRLKYLRKTPEELKADEKEKNAQGGLFTALKFALKHKQLRWLYIVSAFVNLGFAGSINYQAIMTFGYAQSEMKTGVFMNIDDATAFVSTGAVTDAIFMFPVGLALAQVIMGFIADFKGRKAAAVTTAANCLGSFILFSLGSFFAWPPLLTGLFCGIAIGSFYSTNDIIIMMVSESSPTNLRSSTSSAQYIVTALGVVVSMGLNTVLTLNKEIGNLLQAPVCFLLFVPGFFVALWLLIKKVSDTTGIDLDKVTGAEWD